MSEFFWPIRVYYEDTDAGGVVYHANYLKFMERARTERLRDLGFDQDRLREDTGVVFVVHSINLTFHRPARFNELLTVTVNINELSRASAVFDQQIFLTNTDKLLCSGKVRVACVDATTRRARAIPSALSAELSRAS